MTENPQFNWVKAIQIGLIGGAMAVLVSLVGMVEAFHKRDIIAGVISMGQTLLLAIGFTLSYIAARRVGNNSRGAALVSGLVSGLVIGALITGLVLIGQVINLRPVLVNASPALYKILTFDQESIALGIVYLLIGGAGVGLFAGLIYSLPAQVRRAIIAGLIWVALLGLLQELIRLTLTPWPQVTKALSWVFGARNQKGLSVIGAIVVCGVRAAGL
jgi:branched-chain amino acid transport system permease protein